jgi:hypothetical protein
LFDISCLYGTAEFDKVQDDAYEIWQNCDPYELHHGLKIPLVGHHYFISDNGTLRPKFDFTSTGPTQGNPDAFVVATKAVDVPAPNRVQDVDWLELTAVSGKFADEVFRVDTKGGQPPTNVSFFGSIRSIQSLRSFFTVHAGITSYFYQVRRKIL